MDLNFVVFRYQPELSSDKWVPLGVVVECPFEGGTQIGVVCLQAVSIEGSSELADAILQDVPAILRKEVESSRARLRPDEDFLEVLRAQNPWNFHFTVPKTETVETDEIMQATMELFYRYVLRGPTLDNGKASAHKPPKAIN